MRKTRIAILGSRSGTEPYEGRFHTSWILEKDGVLYWFDAGECCGHTAALAGFDLLRSRHIFISHPHMDHIGGLANLIWDIRKLTIVKNRKDPFELTIHTPKRSVFNAVASLLAEAGARFVSCFRLKCELVRDGVLLRNEALTVEARHNHHIERDSADSPWFSFSYRILLEDRTIVYSGDVASLDDLGSWTDNCDLLLMETGHHDPAALCHELKKGRKKIGRLVFLHHGRAFLDRYEETCAAVRAVWGEKILIAEDGMIIDFPE